MTATSPVWITLRAEQWSKEQDQSEIKLATAGNLDREAEAGCWTVSYDESEATGMLGTRTRLSLFDDGSVLLRRRGSVEMSLHFRRGTCHRSHLDTGYGEMDLTLITNELHGSLSSRGGHVHLAYSLSFADKNTVSTRLDLNVEPENQAGDDIGEKVP